MPCRSGGRGQSPPLQPTARVARRLTGRDNWAGARGDIRRIRELANRVCADKQEAAAFLRWLHVRTRKLVDSVWPVIEALAEALLEHQVVHGDALEALLVRALIAADAEDHVPTPWPRALREAVERKRGGPAVEAPAPNAAHELGPLFAVRPARVDPRQCSVAVPWALPADVERTS